MTPFQPVNSQTNCIVVDRCGDVNVDVTSCCDHNVVVVTMFCHPVVLMWPFSVHKIFVHLLTNPGKQDQNQYVKTTH